MSYFDDNENRIINGPQHLRTHKSNVTFLHERDVEIVKKAVALPFEWRTKHGKFISVTQMETRHLFHTLSMIWNHTMPNDAKTHNFERYRFSSFYSQDYMKKAIYFIMRELMTRKDITTEWMKRLKFMADYILKARITLHKEHL